MTLEPVRATVTPPQRLPANGPAPAAPAPVAPPRRHRAPLPNQARAAALAQQAAQEAVDRENLRQARRRADRMSGLTTLVGLVFYFLAVGFGGAIINAVYGAMALLYIIPVFLLLALGFWVRFKRRRNAPQEEI